MLLKANLLSKILERPLCISPLKVVSPSFCKKLLEASQTTFKSSHILKQFSLFGEVVKKMEEARMLMLSASSAAISVQLRPCEWTCTSDGRSITAGQGRQARDFSLNMKHSLHHDGNILRSFSCVRWALRDFTFRPLITFKCAQKTRVNFPRSNVTCCVFF